MSTLNIRLRVAREGQGMTQAEVAERADMAASNVSAIENGARDIRISTLERLVEAMGLEIALLPRSQNSITLEEVLARAAAGRARLESAGLTRSDPEQRLHAKEKAGIDVTVERRILADERG